MATGTRGWAVAAAFALDVEVGQQLAGERLELVVNFVLNRRQGEHLQPGIAVAVVFPPVSLSSASAAISTST
jgi:hypothetical protein